MDNPDYQVAVTLLLVGMLTVAFILVLVVTFGNLLISFVNRYFPEEEKENGIKNPQKGLNSAKISVLVAAVDIATKGKGRLTHVEKVDDSRK